VVYTVEGAKNLVASVKDEPDPRTLAGAIGMMCDFLAEPTVTEKINKVFVEFWHIINLLTMDNPAFEGIRQSDEFWDILKKNIVDLNDNKYKSGLKPIDGQEPFSKAALQDLDKYFQDLQDEFEAHYGLEKNEMPYDLEDDERLDQFHRFSYVLNGDITKHLKESEAVMDQAQFCAYLAQERYLRFHNNMHHIFKEPRLGCKTNVTRIAQKLEELQDEKNIRP